MFKLPFKSVAIFIILFGIGVCFIELAWRTKHYSEIPPSSEIYVNDIRFINLGTGKVTKTLPYYILRDSITGIEYLAIPSVGIIKVEKAQ